MPSFLWEAFIAIVDRFVVPWCMVVILAPMLQSIACHSPHRIHKRLVVPRISIYWTGSLYGDHFTAPISAKIAAECELTDCLARCDRDSLSFPGSQAEVDSDEIFCPSPIRSPYEASGSVQACFEAI